MITQEDIRKARDRVYKLELQVEPLDPVKALEYQKKLQQAKQRLEHLLGEIGLK